MPRRSGQEPLETEKLLPFHVNDSLVGSDRDRVVKALGDSELLRREAALLHAIQDGVRETTEVPKIDELAWQQLQLKLQGESQQPLPTRTLRSLLWLAVGLAGFLAGTWLLRSLG